MLRRLVKVTEGIARGGRSGWSGGGVSAMVRPLAGYHHHHHRLKLTHKNVTLYDQLVTASMAAIRLSTQTSHASLLLILRPW